MQLLYSLVKSYITEAITQKDKIENLQPDDVLVVYHGLKILQQRLKV